LATAYLGSLAFALGERKCHITDSEAAGLLFSSAADLSSAGFQWHHVCDPQTTAYDLATSAVGKIGASAAAADAIIYATCLPLNGNLGDPATFTTSRDVKHLMDFPVSRLQADFGLAGAIAIGLNQQACTSMLGSLRLAGALLGSEPDWQRVLCVTADRFPPGAAYEQAYNLISDGAAACVVTRQPEPGALRLVASHQITNGGLAQATDDETVGSYFSYMTRLIRETLARAGRAVGELDWVVTQNTNEKAWAILARVIGLPLDRVVFPTLPDAGHVISADPVLNLIALTESGSLRPGQLVLLVMAGFGLNWQATVLEAT
jgi:3-oxoacyl-[acyl-carrier-protein] synthase III